MTAADPSDLGRQLGSLRHQLQLARLAADPARQARQLAALDAGLRVLTARADLLRLSHELTPLPTERLEPWPLLEQAWQEVAALAASLGVQAQFRPHADPSALGALYGSGRWLRRLLTECIESAMVNAPGCPIELEHRPFGAHAQIVLPHTRAFTTDHDSPSRQLAEAIAQAHGGALRIEQDEDHRELVVELPTGAPYQAGESSAPAQAARFAQDLAALQERARRRHGVPTGEDR
ncbi:MAG: HAMP domain-containing histidine kinase [Burkholderiales bacterium]|nr:HAMP domain-containing histidine kinase [Burkholderiales bacterium]